MPVKPPRKCPTPGCAGLVSGRVPYCPDCTKARSRSYMRWRGSSAKRGYGRAWDKIAASVLMTEPLCRMCRDAGRITAAKCVDHILPKARGGTDDLENLQPLCIPCHSAKTVREDGGFGRLEKTSTSDKVNL